MQGLVRMQPALGGCVKRNERLSDAGFFVWREASVPVEPVSGRAQALGRAFRAFREYRRVKRDQIECRAFVQIERALAVALIAFVVRPPRCQDLSPRG